MDDDLFLLLCPRTSYWKQNLELFLGNHILVLTFVMLVRPPHVPGIEIRHDCPARFVHKLLDGSGGIAVCLDGVPDHDLDPARLHDEVSLGQDAPTAINGYRQDGDLAHDGSHESPLFEFL